MIGKIRDCMKIKALINTRSDFGDNMGKAVKEPLNPYLFLT